MGVLNSATAGEVREVLKEDERLSEQLRVFLNQLGKFKPATVNEFGSGSPSAIVDAIEVNINALRGDATTIRDVSKKVPDFEQFLE
ncbi:unnamed protein product [Lampetra planeri]